MPSFFMEGFAPARTDRTLFSATPRLTLRQAFTEISAPLPEAASVTFYKTGDGIAVCIRPHGAPDASGREAMLSYQLFPEFHSAVIRRIDAGPEKRKGLGSALIAAQMPFWRRMGVDSLAVRTHDLAEGFYRKLGFVRVDDLPEYGMGSSVVTTMRLDFHDPRQRAAFDRAMAKAAPFFPPGPQKTP